MNGTEHTNDVGGGALLLNLSRASSATETDSSSSFFGADFAKGAALGGLATLGAVYALSKCQQMRKDAAEEEGGFHRI